MSVPSPGREPKPCAAKPWPKLQLRHLRMRWTTLHQALQNTTSLRLSDQLLHRRPQSHLKRDRPRLASKTTAFNLPPTHRPNIGIGFPSIKRQKPYSSGRKEGQTWYVFLASSHCCQLLDPAQWPRLVDVRGDGGGMPLPRSAQCHCQIARYLERITTLPLPDRHTLRHTSHTHSSTHVLKHTRSPARTHARPHACTRARPQAGAQSLSVTRRQLRD